MSGIIVFDTVSGFVRRSFSGLIGLFTDERTGPFLAGVLIALGLVVLVYVIGSWLVARSIIRASVAAVKMAKGADEGERRLAFVSVYPQVDQRLFRNSRLSHAWREFRETLILPNAGERGGGGVIISNSSRPHVFFNPSSLRMNFAFVRHIPNIFVGLGLLGTFLGLIAALTAALGSFDQGAGPNGAQDAILKLLITASAKFYVSAAALAVSIVLTVVVRACSSMLARQISNFNNLLEERLLFATAESIAGQQLEVLKEQSLQLRTFNTDLAMTIGRSIREAVSESNGLLVKQLEGIAATFSRLVEASRQGAGEAISRVVDNTVTSILQETTTAIRTIAESLVSLPSRIEAAANSLNEAGQMASQRQLEIANEMRQQVRDSMMSTSTIMADEVKRGTSGLVDELTASGANLSAGAATFADVLSKFANGGSAVTESLQNISREHAALQQQVIAATRAISQSADDLRTASSGLGQNIADILRAIEQLRATSSETAAATRQIQEQIRGNVEELSRQWARHAGRFDGVDAKMAETFGKLSEQISIQTEQMRVQVTDMDSALAKAVSSLEALVEDMSDAKAVN